jgi:cysteine synthase B
MASILSKIGNTPLLKIKKLASHLKHVSIYAKAEWFNPGGSVKDRPAFYMIMNGIKSGLLTKDKIIIDATSGNTGIAYAMIGSVLGYRVKLAIPKNASVERIRILKAYGAEIIFTDPLEGTDGAQKVVKEIVSKEPERYFYPDQYNNDANWRSHYETTAVEIIRQTRGKITHFVAGLGTTGTFVGTARRLKEFNPQIKAVGVQPDSPFHGIEGLKHLPTAIVPGIFDPNILDELIEVSTEDAYEMVLRLAREEGLLVGVSSGAVMSACLKLAQKIEKGVIVTVFPDSGVKYLSESFWENKNLDKVEWLKYQLK